MKKFEIAKVILEAMFLIGLVGFMWSSIKADSDRQADIEELTVKVMDLQTTINDHGTATKAELESIKADLKKVKENGETYTKQIEGVSESVTKLQKELKDKVEELNEKIKAVEEAKAEKKAAEQAVITASYEPTPAYNPPVSGLTPTSGINNFNGHTESYYNLPMDGVIQQARNFGIEGEYWVRDDGVKMYGDYVICACNRDIYPLGSLVETSFGTGISLDTGSFVAWNPTNVDIGVSW